MATSADDSLSAARASAVTTPKPEPEPALATAARDDDEAGERPHRPMQALVMMSILVLLLGGGLYAGWYYTRSQYYVGVTDDGTVAVFRGIPGEVAGLHLSSEHARSSTKASDLTDVAQQALKQGIRAGNEADAKRKLVDITKGNLKACTPGQTPSGGDPSVPSGSVDPSGSPGTAVQPSLPANGSPDPSASTSPSPSQSASPSASGSTSPSAQAASPAPVPSATPTNCRNP
jgi:protein phosphatase